METTRQTILHSASRLAVTQGEVPSLNALAIAVGISKGGLMHHFPTRDALLTAMVMEGIASVEKALEEAVGRAGFLRTWFKLSIPDEADIVLFQSMASIFFAGKSEQSDIQDLVVKANQRWEALLAQELGSAQAARAALLLGDGLLFGAISGTVTKRNNSDFLLVAEQSVKALMGASR